MVDEYSYLYDRPRSHHIFQVWYYVTDMFLGNDHKNLVGRVIMGVVVVVRRRGLWHDAEGRKYLHRTSIELWQLLLGKGGV